MSFAEAIGQTWQRAAFFAAVFLVIGFVLDAMTGRSIEWSARAVTIVIATGIYWLASAWLLMRRQG